VAISSLAERILPAVQAASSSLAERILPAVQAASSSLAERVLPAVQAASSSLAERILPAVHAATDPRIGLAFVPAVVRSLSKGASIADALQALREAAQRGLIELRPESGLGRLSSDERLLCVPGPEGTLLSWARLRRETGQ
jgi:hypothetical protein